MLFLGCCRSGMVRWWWKWWWRDVVDVSLTLLSSRFSKLRSHAVSQSLEGDRDVNQPLFHSDITRSAPRVRRSSIIGNPAEVTAIQKVMSRHLNPVISSNIYTPKISHSWCRHAICYWHVIYIREIVWVLLHVMGAVIVPIAHQSTPIQLYTTLMHIDRKSSTFILVNRSIHDSEHFDPTPRLSNHSPSPRLNDAADD